jgi:hypothetical protein
MRRLIRLLSVGWLPPSLCPSGSCLSLGSRMPSGSLHATEDYTKTGAASLPMRVGNLLSSGVNPLDLCVLWYHRHLFGNRPHKPSEFPGDSYGDDASVFASCDELSGAFTQPKLLKSDTLWTEFQLLGCLTRFCQPCLHIMFHLRGNHA